MYKLKLDLHFNDEQLASDLQAALHENEVKVVKSIGLLGTTEIIVAIIAATPVVITQIASVIKSYIDRNKSKSFTLKINEEEKTFTGYTTDEIEKVLCLFDNGKE